jgi:two-component system, cell cycle sensor histidine kinase and response regulator CckA
VLLNLGTNAVAALEGRPGRIEFRLDQLDAHEPQVPADVAASAAAEGRAVVRVQVEDNGCGMAAATLGRIFEPFFTTKAVGSGTGLGLPVALGIVQTLGGAITVRSAPGAGSTFSLFFPAAAEPPDGTIDLQPGPDEGTAQPEFRTMDETPASTQHHILYLDDDETLVFLVRRMLERRGYRVTALTDQRQALEAVRRDPQGFDLLLTDYNMPGMSGLEVARAVHALNPALPVAVASGYLTDELQAEARAAGVREVVFKTDAVEAFCEVVARLVSPPPQA